MSASDLTVTGNIANALGVTYSGSGGVVWLEFNTANGRVTDDDGVERIGAGAATLATDGTVTITGIPKPGDSNPVTFQCKIHYDLRAVLPSRRGTTRERGDFGWMTITENATLNELQEEQAVPAEYNLDRGMATAVADDDSAVVTALNGRYLPKIPGKNLYDKDSDHGLDTFWNGADTEPITLAGYYASAKIPIAAGAEYTINNARNIAFFKSDGTLALTRYINNPSEAPYTFTQAGVEAFIGFNVSVANRDEAQMELGDTETEYASYGYELDGLVVDDKHLVDRVVDYDGILRTGPLAVYRDGDDLAIRATYDDTRDIIHPLSLSGGVENMVRFVTDDIPLVMLTPSTAKDENVFPIVEDDTWLHSATDDNAPLNNGQCYFGGSHGWMGWQVTATAHGKTSADLNSQWSDGARTYTLIGIVSANALLFLGPYTVSSGVTVINATQPAATLTHVSGATHTTSVSIAGGVALSAFNPSSFDHSVEVRADAREVPDGKSFCKRLTVTETYKVCSYKDLVDTAQANIGVDMTTLVDTLDPIVRVSNTYRISAPGGDVPLLIVPSQRVVVSEKVTVNLGVTQAFPLELPAGGTRKQTMAGIGTVGSFNFATYADLSATAVGQTDIGPAAYAHALDPASRMVQWTFDSGGDVVAGLAIGILPTADGRPERRVANTATKSWFMANNTKKNYPQLAWAKTLAIGESLSGTAFRAYLAPSAYGGPVVIPAADDAETWVMVDHVGTATDTKKPLPELLGRRLRPINKRTTVTVPDRIGGDGIAVTVASSPGYGTWKADDQGNKVETIPGATSAVGSYFVTQWGAVTTLALTGSYEVQYLFAVYQPEATPLDRVAIEVTVLGTGVIRLGEYGVDPNTGLPLTTGPIYDHGTVSVTSTGIKEITLSGVTLPAGWRYFTLAWQGSNTTAPTIRIMAAATGFGPFNIGTSNTLMSGSRMCYSQSSVSGAFGTLTSVAAQQVTPPRVAYRRA